MTPKELLTDMLLPNLEMMKMTIADFSEADMLVRPTPAANHAAWQLGHLAVAESHLVNMFQPGAVPEIPAAFMAKFTKETSKVNDPAAFPKKAELLDALTNARLATIAWAKGLSDADLAKPGPEKMKGFAPTIGHLIAMTPCHTMMHVGQFQVIRRALGKPVIF
ncbi:MAG: hypothetical protein JWL69_3013 [Phycisphaerales bacterium]|nr:hypothetical protein [Phycisphaerales bacterium]MDB5357686.1 hypothetical protein [Phycisphaerales bacterium]